MKLYGITKTDIEDVIKTAEIRMIERNRHIAIRKIKDKFENMPLKVVYTMEDEDNIVITAYPLKKSYKEGGKDESKL